MKTIIASILLALLSLAAARLPAAEPPAALARWLAPQDWEKDTEGPIVSLGAAGEFDDMHIFAPAVAEEGGEFRMWYCGSRGTRTTRVFRLGLATSRDGKRFEKYAGNPVLAFADGEHSILTPGLLRTGDGNALREQGRLRAWFSSTVFGKTGLHTLHDATSADGIHWSEPSGPLLNDVYCPSVLAAEAGYQMWYVDVSRRPWVIRYATRGDGRKWAVREGPVLQLSQPWEAEIVVYPCVLKIDGVYLMWYGSYNHAVRRQTTAIGFAASTDGIHWHKHPANPVLRPDAKRPWEANYVTSGSVMRLKDGSFRYWYASRKAPPFENLYFAINTARWSGPKVNAPPTEHGRLPLPPREGDVGTFAPALAGDGRAGRSVDVLEVIDEDDAIIRAWYSVDGDKAGGRETGFVDLWLHGVDTTGATAGSSLELTGVFRVAGTRSLDTACGGRKLLLVTPLARP
jgi:predicted GH43/DUF377 family glycosyl hydrolase